MARPERVIAVAPGPRWHLHLGAHKTATTHVQQVLERIGPGLAPTGLHVVPPAAARRASMTMMRRRDRVLHLIGRTDPAQLRRALLSDAARPETVLVSDENVLGRLEDALDPVCYRGLTWRLRLLRRAIDGDPVTVFLAIRRMDRFLPAIYAQILRHRPPPKSFAAIKADLLNRPPRWSDVADRIAAALPGTELRLWRYEDYAGNERAVLSQLCGSDPGPLPEVPRPAETMTPSARRIAEIEALPRPRDRGAWIATVRDLLAKPEAEGAPPYRPFDAAESARLGEAYASDCAELEAQARLISP